MPLRPSIIPGWYGNAPPVFLGLILLLVSSPRAGHATVRVQDSPLYGAMLANAISDLKAPVTASSGWNLKHAAEAAGDLVFGTPAYGQALNSTMVSEATLCRVGGKYVTQCDKSTGSRQVCTATVHSQKKTDCAAATVCKDGGTACPGDGKKNKCSTAAGTGVTKCVDAGPTLCNGQATRCQSGDRQECATFAPNQAKTTCKAGRDHATLCYTEATGCSSKGKNICSTTKSNDKTSCTASDNITQCHLSGTTCTDDDLNEGCEFYSVAMSGAMNGTFMGPPPGRQTGGDDQGALVAIHTDSGFFTTDPTANIQFIPSGPVIAEQPQVYATDEAHFYVNFPAMPVGSTQAYQVVAFSPNGTRQLPELLVDSASTLPGMNQVGIIVLITTLVMLGTLALRRRREDVA